MTKSIPVLYISVDVEASGPIPGEYSLLSVGACLVTDTKQNIYCEIKPINNNFELEAMKVNGLNLEKLRLTGESPAVAMARFETWIKQTTTGYRPVFIAFNATFDWMFTHWYFIKYLGRDPFGISGLDIKAYFAGKHNASWGETGKSKIRSLYHSKTRHTHNALDDAIEQAEIFIQLLQKS